MCCLQHCRSLCGYAREYVTLKAWCKSGSRSVSPPRQGELPKARSGGGEHRQCWPVIDPSHLPGHRLRSAGQRTALCPFLWKENKAIWFISTYRVTFCKADSLHFICSISLVAAKHSAPEKEARMGGKRRPRLTRKPNFLKDTKKNKLFVGSFARVCRY